MLEKTSFPRVCVASFTRANFSLENAAGDQEPFSSGSSRNRFRAADTNQKVVGQTLGGLTRPNQIICPKRVQTLSAST